jgi:hypothetical protein
MSLMQKSFEGSKDGWKVSFISSPVVKRRRGNDTQPPHAPMKLRQRISWLLENPQQSLFPHGSLVKNEERLSTKRFGLSAFVGDIFMPGSMQQKV